MIFYTYGSRARNILTNGLLTTFFFFSSIRAFLRKDIGSTYDPGKILNSLSKYPAIEPVDRSFEDLLNICLFLYAASLKVTIHFKKNKSQIHINRIHLHLAASLYGSLMVTYSISLNKPIRSISSLVVAAMIRMFEEKESYKNETNVAIIFPCFSGQQQTK